MLDASLVKAYDSQVKSLNGSDPMQALALVKLPATAAFVARFKLCYKLYKVISLH